MAQTDPWLAYVDAMRSHLAQNERLSDRLRYFVGDALKPPAGIDANDRGAWLALVAEAESAARRHRLALETFLGGG